MEAQWRAATAAENAVALAQRQARWAALEFFALLGTLLTAFVAIMDSRKHTVAELRAYVHLTPGDVSGYKIGETPSVEVKIFNNGATPAYALKFYGSPIILPHPLPGDPAKFFSHVDAGPVPRTVIQKDGMIEGDLQAVEPITEAAYKGVIAGTHAVYVIGAVEYEDAFRKPRKSNFCVFAARTELGENITAAAKGGAPGVAVHWEYTRLYNDAN